MSQAPAVAFLVNLGGQMQANKKEGERLADAMRNVEAVIRLFDPAFAFLLACLAALELDGVALEEI